MTWSCPALVPGSSPGGGGHLAHAGAKSRAPACHRQWRGRSSIGASAEKKIHSSAGWGPNREAAWSVTAGTKEGRWILPTRRKQRASTVTAEWSRDIIHLLHHKLGSNDLLRSERLRTLCFVPTAMTVSRDYIPRWVQPRKMGRHIWISVRSWIWIQKANWKSKRW